MLNILFGIGLSVILAHTNVKYQLYDASLILVLAGTSADACTDASTDASANVSADKFSEFSGNSELF